LALALALALVLVLALAVALALFGNGACEDAVDQTWFRTSFESNLESFMFPKLKPPTLGSQIEGTIKMKCPIIISVWRGVSKGVEDSCRPPTM
jgi:hypothetical protein